MMMMNGNVGIRPEDAAAFIVAINEMQKYVPPMIFNQLAANPISVLLSEVANKRAELEIKPATQITSEVMRAQ